MNRRRFSAARCLLARSFSWAKIFVGQLYCIRQRFSAARCLLARSFSWAKIFVGQLYCIRQRFSAARCLLARSFSWAKIFVGQLYCIRQRFSAARCLLARSFSWAKILSVNYFASVSFLFPSALRVLFECSSSALRVLPRVLPTAHISVLKTGERDFMTYDSHQI